MPSRSPKPPSRVLRSKAKAPGARRTVDPCAACTRKLRRLQADHEQERTQHARQLAAVRRAADRRLAAMMQEIALLRHHQARAEALERLLTERTSESPPAPAEGVAP